MKFFLSVIFLTFSFLLSGQLKIEVLGVPTVGDSVEVVIRASHSKPIKELWLVRDNDYVNQIKKNCNSSLACEVKSKISLNYEGSIRIRSFLWEFPNSAVSSLDTFINFTCSKEYCEPDTLTSNFFIWMRNKGYDEAIISKYYTYAKDGVKRALFKEFYNNPLVKKLKPTMNINFYDIIPTDQNSTFVEMSTQNAVTCTPSTLWPEFCPSARPADYKMIEEHLSRVFGVEYKVNYIRRPTNYKNEIGTPKLNSFDRYEYRFQDLNVFEINNFNRADIVHYGIRTLDGKNIEDGTSGTHVARMFRNFKTSSELAVFTHELGHSYGLPHSFINGSSPLDLFSLDGIMSNTYIAHTSMFDPLDPLERYTFEPVEGYKDNNTYVEKYNNGIKPTFYFNNIFQNLEPFVSKLDIINVTDDFYVFEADLGNSGSIDCPFFVVHFYNEEKLITSRIIENIPAGSAKKIRYSVLRSSVEGNTFSIKVDPNNQIKDENNNNNFIEINITSVDNSSIDGVKVFPNPVRDELFISKEGPWKLKLYDILGNLVISETVLQSVLVDKLVNGTYILHLIDNKSGNHVDVKKIQILR